MGIQLTGNLSSRPIALKDLVAINTAIRDVYARVLPIVEGEDRKCLMEVLRIASDGLCNICHEMNIDPTILDYWIEEINACIIFVPPERQ